MNTKHQSGFVNIVGQPNVGKSTLMNALMKDKLSIITSKPQTTRHRIFGIASDDNYQIIFSDSPGIIDTPRYGLQNVMNKFAYTSFEDADIFLFVIDPFEEYQGEEAVIKSLKKATVPKFLIINKIDLIDEEKLNELRTKWTDLVEWTKIFEISALEKRGIQALYDEIIIALPEGPAYYPKDQISDKPERFFVSEIIREKLLLLYKQEIPYSCEVMVTYFKEEDTKSGPMIRIRAEIYTERNTQKSIIIGKNGEAIKKLGTAARKDIEAWLDHKVFLDLFVKVKENWRDSEKTLKHFGYEA